MALARCRRNLNCSSGSTHSGRRFPSLEKRARAPSATRRTDAGAQYVVGVAAGEITVVAEVDVCVLGDRGVCRRGPAPRRRAGPAPRRW